MVLFFSFSPWKRITQYIYMERKNTAILAEPSFFLFRYLFLVMSYLSDRKHKWQQQTVLRLAAVCMKNDKIYGISSGLFLNPLFKKCYTLYLHDTDDQQHAFRSPPGTEHQGCKWFRMAGQEVSQIVFLPLLCASSFLWMRGKYNNSSVICE